MYRCSSIRVYALMSFSHLKELCGKNSMGFYVEEIKNKSLKVYNCVLITKIFVAAGEKFHLSFFKLLYRCFNPKDIMRALQEFAMQYTLPLHTKYINVKVLHSLYSEYLQSEQFCIV